MAATYLLRRHLATMRSAGTPEAIAERRLYRGAATRAMEDLKAAYPVITSENFEEANGYRLARIEHWKRALAKMGEV